MQPRQRRLRWVLAILLCLTLFISLAGAFLVVDDGAQPADAIIVIGGDHKPERVQRAVELYLLGYAPLVILSAGTPVLEGNELLAEAEVMRRQALALGLPETALLVEDESQSTYQNAYYTRALCEQRGITSILLVTSAYHSRRARRIFHEVFGTAITVYVQPAPPELCRVCWPYQPDQAAVVFYEYRNWARYWQGVRLPAEAPPAGAEP